MSVEVIKAGVDPHHKYLGVCQNCGTIFTYDWDDVKDNQISAWHEHHVICPVCTYESAWSNKPLRNIEFKVEGSGIFINSKAAQIPTGCQAYAIYQNGNDILLRQLFNIIPENMPTLIVGNCTEITEIPVPGVGEVLPNFVKLRVQAVNEKDKTSYLTFDETLTPVKIKEDTVAFYGIPKIYYKNGESTTFTELFRVLNISGDAYEDYLLSNDEQLRVVQE